MDEAAGQCWGFGGAGGGEELIADVYGLGRVRRRDVGTLRSALSLDECFEELVGGFAPFELLFEGGVLLFLGVELCLETLDLVDHLL